MGVVNYMCGSSNTESKAKQKLVKGQLTLFGERVSSDTDNLVRADSVFCEYCSSQDGARA